MKASLRKLRGFGIHKPLEPKDTRDLRSLSQLDELAQASQDLEDMRNCYDNLLSAAAATTNSAYEFSESLREMGDCLLEKTAQNDDEDGGKVLLMLGKVQYELHKHLDSYRSHISRTITIPSQSLLNELRTVEEMKQQCDEKRNMYEDILRKQRDKGRTRSGRREHFTLQQLQEAYEQFDEEATLFIFRLKSLKQGQSRSLLTQAARHHAAQLNFFKKALKSLEEVAPHVKFVTEQQHIDYHFDELEDDEGDEPNDDQDDDSYDGQDDGELSFDYGQSDQDPDPASPTMKLMELDQVDLTFPQVSTNETTKETIDKIAGDYKGGRSGEIRKIAQSAPLFAEKKLDLVDRMDPLRQSSTRKLQTYVLPTPTNAKISTTATLVKPFRPTRQISLKWRNQKLWHSSPLEPKKFGKTSADEKFSRTAVLGYHGILKDSNSLNTAPILPPPLTEGLLSSNHENVGVSSSKKIKRQAFSGPIYRSPPTQPVPVKPPHLFSGPILRNPISQPLSSPPKVSPISPPPLTSSPKISELHELPRPPASSNSISTRHSGFVGYSAPLFSRGQDHSVKEPVVLTTASLLPTPPQIVPRSFSIPSSGLRTTSAQVSKPLEMSHNVGTTEDVASPPLTPISWVNTQPLRTTTLIVVSPDQTGGAN